MAKVDKLVIDRAMWGKGSLELTHGPDKGKMCCLGFLAKACGAPTTETDIVSDSDYVHSLALPKSSWVDDYGYPKELASGPLQSVAVTLNDTRDLPNGAPRPTTEGLLISLFQQAGITLSFVGTPAELEYDKTATGVLTKL